MKEESAIDAIFEIKNMLEAQRKEVDLLKKSIAIVDSKINESLMSTIYKAIEKSIAEPVIIEASEVEFKQESESIIIEDKSSRPRKNIKAFGHLQDELGKNLPGIEVIIKDTHNNVVKSTKTNKGGVWMSFLPPGRYSVEFSAPGMRSDFRTFDLIAGQKEVEIT